MSKNFAESLQEVLNEKKNSEKTLTANGAVAYKSSKTALVDFNFAISGYRNSDPQIIKNDFSKILYEEGEDITAKYLAYVMDIREGLGERQISKFCLQWLAETRPDIVIKIMPFIDFYNRWDTVVFLTDPNQINNEFVRNFAIEKIKNQLIEDLKNVNTNKSISLLGKWMPSENASSKETVRIARYLQKELNVTPKNYRRMLSLLRSKLHVVECDMSSNNWGNIEYSAVPSKANLNYANSFMRHDEERRKEYLESLKKGETKINAKTLAPHEIIRKYTGNYGWYLNSNTPYNEDLELLWKNLKNNQVGDLLIVRDGSGSMTTTTQAGIRPLDVATALAIYASERNKGIWKDKFITFSANPKFIDLSKCKTLRDKLERTYQEDSCENTNIYKTMRLILDVAVKNNYKQKDFPTICILSDMQFDGCSFHLDESLFDSISDLYESYGYTMPKIIFWNLDTRVSRTIPMQQNSMGLILLSGFSTNLFNMVLSNEIDPYKALLKILNSERYKPVEDALRA
jgi:hypothetical protein